jgi:uncharacterized protein YqhQ
MFAVYRVLAVIGIPLIAGLSYEVIKWAGKNRRKRWVRAVMWPGLMLQNLKVFFEAAAENMEAVVFTAKFQE